jgi:hypothetical protein
MKSLRVLPALLLLAFAGSSAAAYGACSASFIGNCSWLGASTADCAFSASYDCGSAVSSSFSWDFGDGNSDSGVLVYNTYTNPGAAGAYEVSFTVTCTDSCSATATRYVCFTLGVFGCVQPDSDWN